MATVVATDKDGRIYDVPVEHMQSAIEQGLTIDPSQKLAMTDGKDMYDVPVMHFNDAIAQGLTPHSAEHSAPQGHPVVGANPPQSGVLDSITTALHDTTNIAKEYLPFSNTIQSGVDVVKAGGNALLDGNDPRTMEDYYNQYQAERALSLEQSEKRHPILGNAAGVATGIVLGLESAPVQAVEGGVEMAVKYGVDPREWPKIEAALRMLPPAAVPLVKSLKNPTVAGIKWIGEKYAKMFGKADDVIKAYGKNPERYNEFAEKAAEQGMGPIEAGATPIRKTMQDLEGKIANKQAEVTDLKEAAKDAVREQRDAWVKASTLPTDIVQTARDILKSQRGKIGDAAEKQLDALSKSDAKVNLTEAKSILQDALDTSIGDPSQRAQVQYFVKQLDNLVPEKPPVPTLYGPKGEVIQLEQPPVDIVTDAVQTRKLRSGMQENIPYGKNDWNAADRALHRSSKEVNASLDRALPEASSLRGEVAKEVETYEQLSKLFGNEGQEWSTINATLNNPQSLDTLRAIEKATGFSLTGLSPVQAYLKVKSMTGAQKNAALNALDEVVRASEGVKDLKYLKSQAAAVGPISSESAEQIARNYVNAGQKVPQMETKQALETMDQTLLPGIMDTMEKTRVSGQMFSGNNQVNRVGQEAAQATFGRRMGAVVTAMTGTNDAMIRNLLNPESKILPATGQVLKSAENQIVSQSGGAFDAATNDEDKLSRMPPKYRVLLESAAQRGPQSLAETHFKLQQLFRDYREAVNKKDK